MKRKKGSVDAPVAKTWSGKYWVGCAPSGTSATESTRVYPLQAAQASCTAFASLTRRRGEFGASANRRRVDYTIHTSEDLASYGTVGVSLLSKLKKKDENGV